MRCTGSGIGTRQPLTALVVEQAVPSGPRLRVEHCRCRGIAEPSVHNFFALRQTFPRGSAQDSRQIRPASANEVSWPMVALTAVILAAGVNRRLGRTPVPK